MIMNEWGLSPLCLHFNYSRISWLCQAYVTCCNNDTQDFDEIDVIVDDVPYTHSDGIYQDPDEQLCEHYGIDYENVNCIEVA